VELFISDKGLSVSKKSFTTNSEASNTTAVGIAILQLGLV
jgi:hypothetical protein